jgi:hypothetical protein
MTQTIISAVGFTGAIFTLSAYFQVSRGKWKGTSTKFQVCNAVAALLLIWYGLQVQGYANVFLNAVWLLIALAALFRIASKR